MKIAVNEETIKKTTQCDKGFRCLNGHMDDLCNVVDMIGSNIVITYCGMKPECPYCQVIQGLVEGFCMCPTRIEILKTHGC